MKYLELLKKENKFSRVELLEAMHKCGVEIGEASFKVTLQKLLTSGQIARVGRNAYCVPDKQVHNYRYQYSEATRHIAEQIQDKFPYLDFTIMDFVQMNEFVNHQLAHNVVFVSVEDDLGDFVFAALKELYPGKVLINPTPEIYHQYWYDDMIVIEKLVSEAPMGKNERWNTRIEKLLVDLLTSSILESAVSSAELSNIYEDAFKRYAIDESCLFRYAKRRGADKKIKEFIKEKTNIRLRTE